MSEASGHPAKTLHRLLEFSHKENRFQRGPDNPLDCDLLIIDEASMIDIWLGSHLLSAIAEPTRLLLVGERQPVAARGAGPAAAPYNRKQRGHRGPANRNFSAKKAAASSWKTPTASWPGGCPTCPGPGQEADFYFIENNDPIQCAQEIADLASRRLPGKFGFDPLTRSRCLRPCTRATWAART